MKTPRLNWDSGTAHDLFVSLRVLHRPADFGIARAWVAAIRARLPAAERATLESAHTLPAVPLHWICAQPPPKNGATALGALAQVRQSSLCHFSPWLPTGHRRRMQTC